MIGEILEIKDNNLIVKNNNIVQNVMNLYVKIMDNNNIYVGEIINLNKEVLNIKLIGEIINNNFIYGISKKPAFNSKISFLNNDEIKLLFGINNYNPKNSLYIGRSAFYENYPIFLNLNNLFSNHFVVLGNTGSGKSCGVARLLQNLFYKKDANPINATFFIIDAYGEYKNAFSQINYVNKDLQFKYFNSDVEDNNLIKIPLWLLSLDDICLLLEVNDKNQIPIVEKALKLVTIFVKNDEVSNKYKNSIIASSILDIFINGNTPAQIRDQVFSVLARYNTPELNLNSPVYLPGYTRPLKQCLMIDNTGKIKDMELVISFLQQFILEDLNLNLPDNTFMYTLKDLLYAFDFALIDEGILNNNHIYKLSNELRVRLASIVNSKLNKIFEFDKHITKKEFFEFLTINNNAKCQVININLNNFDDRFAKIVAKIYSKFLFDYGKYELERAKHPIHIVLEEAHRYVQNDNDVLILGYNIFERIAKEGRKYGVLLNLISQRPSELSQTVLSQCTNFLVFKITHPADIDYIKPMIPNVSEDMVEKIKNLQIGHALIFGNAFSFPTIISLDMASPSPASSSSDISNCWF